MLRWRTVSDLTFATDHRTLIKAEGMHATVRRYNGSQLLGPHCTESHSILSLFGKYK
jgi:hypothetical protein